MKFWFTANELAMLGDVKSNHMFRHFDEFILQHISPYFQPLVPHIKQFWSALHPEQHTCHSTSTGRDIVDVFKLALLDAKLIHQARQSQNTLGKRALPGDLSASENGWDAVKPNKKQLRSKADMKPGNLGTQNEVMKRRRRLAND